VRVKSLSVHLSGSIFILKTVLEYLCQKKLAEQIVIYILV